MLAPATWVAWAGGALDGSWAGPPLSCAGLGVASAWLGVAGAGLGCDELELEPVCSQTTHVCWSRQHGWHGPVLSWAEAGLALGRAGAWLSRGWAALRLQLGCLGWRTSWVFCHVCWPRPHGWHGPVVR